MPHFWNSNDVKKVFLNNGFLQMANWIGKICGMILILKEIAKYKSSG